MGEGIGNTLAWHIGGLRVLMRACDAPAMRAAPALEIIPGCILTAGLAALCLRLTATQLARFLAIHHVFTLLTADQYGVQQSPIVSEGKPC